MPVVRRNSPVLLVRKPFLVRRGMGADSTLATGAALPGFCASLPPNQVMAYPDCASLPASVIQAAAASTPSGQANALAIQNAPPVYTSTFTPTGDPTSWLNTSYGINNTAAAVVNQVNRNNANAYAQYQQALANALANPGVPMPAPPAYQDFNSVWAQQNLGMPPASVGQAAPGTQMPVYQTDTQSPGPSSQIPAPLLSNLTTAVQSNAPAPTVAPAPAPTVQSNAPSPTAVAPSGGLLQTLQNLVLPPQNGAPGQAVPATGDWFGTIPNWVVIGAAGGLGLLLFWPKGKG